MPPNSCDTFREPYPDFDSPCDDPLWSVMSDFFRMAPSDFVSSVFDLVSLDPVP